MHLTAKSRKIKLLSPAVWTIVFFASCVQPPDYPLEPVIEYQRLSANTMSQGISDTEWVLATISFTDGDGDLGNEDGAVTLFVRDLRDSTFDNSANKLPVVPQKGSNNGISGEITFRIFQTCCIWPAGFEQENCTPSARYPVDTIQYEVFIKDRAGHESNHVFLDPIFLKCD
jgi:hypothetical protein